MSWELDSTGVRIPKQVAKYGVLARARYKAKRRFKLSEEEAAALCKAQEEKHRRWAKKRRASMAVRRKRQEKLRYLRHIGFPTTKAGQERMMAVLSLEFDQGITDRREQAKALGIRFETLVRFMNTYQKYYVARMDEYLQALRKKLEQKLATERIASMQRTLALNPEVDRQMAETLRNPEASHAAKVAVMKMVKDTLGMTRDDMREDDKMEMARERHTAELDTIKLLTARGRFQAALPPPVESDGEVIDVDSIEDEEDDNE